MPNEITLNAGSAQVNAVMQFNAFMPKLLIEGTVWLKSGFVETDLATYPDATTNFSYTGFNSSVSAQDTAPKDVYVDDSYIWVLGDSTLSVYRYDKTTGSYDSFSFSVSAQESSPQSITGDDTYLYVTGSTSDSVHRYNKSTGAFVDTLFNFSAQEGNVRGLTVDSDTFYIVGLAGTVFEYNKSDGTYKGPSFDIDVSAEASAPVGVAVTGDYLYLTDSATDAIYKFVVSTKEYTEFSFSVANEDLSPGGLHFNSNAIYMIGQASDSFYRYDEIVGISAAATNADTGLPYYTRIK